MTRASVVAGRVAVAALFLGAWEFGARLGVLDPFFFSRPSSVAARVAEMLASGKVWPHLATTTLEAALAFLIGSLLGVACGFALARSRWMAEVLGPYIQVANSLPRVVLAPVFLLWFGLGIASKVALGVTVVFFVVFFNTMKGVREVPRALIDNARMLGATERQLARHVLLPSALSWIFSSLEISVGLAIIAAVVGEYLGAVRGIGYLIAQAEGVFDTTGVFAGMTFLAAFVLIVSALVSRLERRLLKWRPASAYSLDSRG
jgi:NitT/TauT family transport system permease protein